MVERQGLLRLLQTADRRVVDLIENNDYATIGMYRAVVSELS